jgi:hypothetical protein
MLPSDSINSLGNLTAFISALNGWPASHFHRFTSTLHGTC